MPKFTVNRKQKRSLKLKNKKNMGNMICYICKKKIVTGQGWVYKLTIDKHYHLACINKKENRGPDPDREAI